jgi:putative acetyltransferase
MNRADESSLPMPASKQHLAAIASVCLLLCACDRAVSFNTPVGVDRTIVKDSAHPTAIDPLLVGTYPGRAFSGAGYFWDDVLEYRVWFHVAGSACFRAFASYEPAAEFSARTQDAEVPIVLIRQREWIGESEPNQYQAMATERITEWQVEWLEGAHRGPRSIADFLAHGGREPGGVREVEPPEQH